MVQQQQEPTHLIFVVYFTIKLIHVCMLIHFCYVMSGLANLWLCVVFGNADISSDGAVQPTTIEHPLKVRQEDSGELSQGEASDSCDDHSEGVPLTDVFDSTPNASATLSTIKVEIKRKNNTEPLRTKLECIAATRKLMTSMCNKCFFCRYCWLSVSYLCLTFIMCFLMCI